MCVRSVRRKLLIYQTVEAVRVNGLFCWATMDLEKQLCCNASLLAFPANFHQEQARILNRKRTCRNFSSRILLPKNIELL